MADARELCERCPDHLLDHDGTSLWRSPWGSSTSLGLFGLSLVSTIAFVAIELRAVEPLLPLRLIADRTIALSLIASFGIAIVMFGSIIYIPVYAQGVVGVNATDSGLILMPLMLGFIICGILTGLAITRTGRYRPFMLIARARIAPPRPVKILLYPRMIQSQ